MVTKDLIAAHDDPDDLRRKVYTLVSVMLAHSNLLSNVAMIVVLNLLTNIVNDRIKTCDILTKFCSSDSMRLNSPLGPYLRY